MLQQESSLSFLKKSLNSEVIGCFTKEVLACIPLRLTLLKVLVIILKGYKTKSGEGKKKNSIPCYQVQWNSLLFEVNIVIVL